MSRTLTEIYNESVEARNKYLELTELTNDSKMSIINAFTWVTSAVIYSFETLLSVFTTDIAQVFNTRINGTPAYYANSMLKWQYGDELVVNDEGTSFSYATTDTTKCLITHVSYQEIYQEEYKDNLLLLKAAKGSDGALEKLEDDELISARAYLNQIKFAGVKCRLVSRKGDVIVPRLTVYYDGAVPKSELYDLIDASLSQFLSNIKFNSVLYVQKMIDAIQQTEHVTDVFVNPNATVEQGVFVAQYDDNDQLGALQKVDRKTELSSGYAKESTRADAEADIPTFREALVVELEDDVA